MVSAKAHSSGGGDGKTLDERILQTTQKMQSTVLRPLKPVGRHAAPTCPCHALPLPPLTPYQTREVDSRLNALYHFSETARKAMDQVATQRARMQLEQWGPWYARAFVPSPRGQLPVGR